MKLNFIKNPKQGILTLFGAIVIMLFLPVGTSTWVSMSRAKLDHEQTQAIFLKEETNNLLSALTDMETGQRGYIITGKLAFLEPYNDGHKRLDALLPSLRDNLNANPEMKADMTELDSWIEFKLAELDRTIKIRNTLGLKDAREVIAKGLGRQYMDQIRILITDLTDKQTTHVAKLSKQLHKRSTISLIAGGSTIVVCIGLLVILTLCLFRLVDQQKKYYDERQLLFAKISNIAYYDTLTGLSNRARFNDESQKMTARAIHSKDPMCLFMIDLDNFKNINDSYGHQVGDVVLKSVATRLQNIVTQRTGRNCLAARLGGDEFVVMFEQMTNKEAIVVGQQINNELKQPIQAEGNQIYVSTSIGISVFPEGGEDITTLLKSADLAMYVSKERGKDQFCFYETWMNTKMDRRIEAELVVRDILATGQVSVFYQPIVSTETGCIVGAEALLRGKKSQELFFDPMELIVAAEDTNLIFPLGTMILKNACAFAKQCIDQIGENTETYVSVNVSAFQLINVNFAGIVEQTLKESNLSPKHLVLEITETMLMQDFENSAKMLSKLRDLGIRISIDDFGKGYSSFSYLQKLPIDKIKIDMSFIQSLGQDTKSNEIVKAIILMADTLGMHTCAEGVETETQYNKLVEYGCEQVQGYYKHKALSPADFVDLITKKVV